MDGELDAGQHRGVAEHLTQCAGCREELEELRGVDSLLEGLPQLSLSAEFAQIVATRAQETGLMERKPHLLSRAWNAMLEYSERFFELLQPESRIGSRSLDEFNDMPASFIGYAYFRVLGSQR